MLLSIIVPIYNEELNIALLYQRLKTILVSMPLSYEFIFVNDGSKDQSLNLIKDISKKDFTVKYINFSRNFGHQIAVSAGIDTCKGDAVVIIDADLQDPPELIKDMYEKYKLGFEVVYAKRKKREGESFLKTFTAKLFYRLLKTITNVEIPVDTGDFRLMDKKIVDVLKQMPEKSKFLRGQISWIGFNQTFVEYNRDERHAGTTGYTYKKMFRFALDGITSFSNFPLKLATWVGFIVSLLSFILIIWAVYARYFKTETYVDGWASIMVSVLFIGGIQLLCVGIIGEYIIRIIDNVRNRPLYVIKETNMA